MQRMGILNSLDISTQYPLVSTLAFVLSFCGFLSLSNRHRKERRENGCLTDGDGVACTQMIPCDFDALLTLCI